MPPPLVQRRCSLGKGGVAKEEEICEEGHIVLHVTFFVLQVPSPITDCVGLHGAQDEPVEDAPDM